MLAQFDLFGFGEEAEECSFVAIEESGFLGEDFFGGARLLDFRSRGRR